jgi:hypothetical protein
LFSISLKRPSFFVSDLSETSLNLMLGGQQLSPTFETNKISHSEAPTIQHATFVQSIAYWVETKKLKNLEDLKSLLVRITNWVHDRKPTLRQLITGIDTLYTGIHYQYQSILSEEECDMLVVSFLIALSNESYMTPTDTHEAESLINAIIRILKKEMEDPKSNSETNLNRTGNPWVVGLCSLFLSKFVRQLKRNTSTWDAQSLFVSI